MQIVERTDSAYYVQGRPAEPLASLAEARIRAAWHQFRGDRRSLTIYRGGRAVDLKRF